MSDAKFAPAALGLVLLGVYVAVDPWVLLSIPTIIAITAACGDAATEALERLAGVDPAKTYMDLFGMLRYVAMTAIGAICIAAGAYDTLLRLQMIKWTVELGAEHTVNAGKPEAELMKLHHLVTMTLLVLAQFCDIKADGVAVIWMHDATDVVVSATKFAHHAGPDFELASKGLFALMAGAVWPYWRVWWLGGFVLSRVATYPTVVSAFLAALWTMQAYWWAEMLRIGFKLLAGANPSAAAAGYYKKKAGSRGDDGDDAAETPPNPPATPPSPLFPADDASDKEYVY